jgi:hypothetical protein
LLILEESFNYVANFFSNSTISGYSEFPRPLRQLNPVNQDYIPLLYTELASNSKTPPSSPNTKP